MKKLIFAFLLFFSVVYAEGFYVTKGGVTLTDKEYDILVKMYDENYVSNLTQEQFARFSNIDMNNDDIMIVSYVEPLLEATATPSEVYLQTNSKKLTLTVADSGTYKTMVTTLLWLAVPSVKSFDDIGFRFTTGLTKSGSIHTELDTDVGYVTCTNYVIGTYGAGCSVKLTSSATNFALTQTTTFTGSGYLYASYQHATQAVLLSEAKNYTISSAGYGYVFNFATSVASKYDHMSGLSLAI